MTINQAIFNTNKTDYGSSPIFLGESRGLQENITRQYPEQTALYEQLRNQDWTEKEFVFELSKIDFETCDPVIANDMLRTLAYQWETDTSAGSSISVIMGPVCSSPEIWAGYQRISDNEVIHALTYSEIVRQCFTDSMGAIERFRNDMNAHSRLSVVAEVFEQAAVSSARWNLYKLRPDVYPLTTKEREQIYDHMFLYVIALLVMERGQFMPSFSVTFGICEMQLFQVIGDAVQRIAQDEIEVHVPFGKANIRSLLKTDQGRDAFKRLRHLIVKMIEESYQTEENWIGVMHDDGHELVGLPPSLLQKFNRFGFTDISTFLGLEKEMKFELVTENPISYMNDRVNLATTQASPQEAPPTAYLVNALTKDDEGKIWELGLD